MACGCGCANPCNIPCCPPPPPRCCPDKCCSPCCAPPKLTLRNPDPCKPCCRTMLPPMPCCPTYKCLPQVCCPPPCCPDPCIKPNRRCNVPPPCDPPCCKKMMFVVSPPYCPPRCCPPPMCCPPCKDCCDPCLPMQYRPHCCSYVCGRKANDYPDYCCPSPAMIVRPLRHECCTRPERDTYREECPIRKCQQLDPYSIILRRPDRCRNGEATIVNNPQDCSQNIDPSSILNCGQKAFTLKVTNPIFRDREPFNPDPGCCAAPCPPPTDPKPNCPMSLNRSSPHFSNTTISMGCCYEKPKCPVQKCCKFDARACPQTQPTSCFVAVRPCPPLCCPGSGLDPRGCC